jgi:hypothetical protein
MNMTIEMIELWHHRVRPAPAVRDLKTQLGCHFEEIAEMLETLSSSTLFIKDHLDQMRHNAEILAHCCKQGDDVAITDRKECLDALADQIVTAVGPSSTRTDSRRTTGTARSSRVRITDPLCLTDSTERGTMVSPFTETVTP